MLKASHNAADDGLAGVQQLAGDATLLFYMTEEAQKDETHTKISGVRTSISFRVVRECGDDSAHPRTVVSRRVGRRLGGLLSAVASSVSGLTSREGMLIKGPSGWGEFALFDDYDTLAARVGWRLPW